MPVCRVVCAVVELFREQNVIFENSGLSTISLLLSRVKSQESRVLKKMLVYSWLVGSETIIKVMQPEGDKDYFA